MAGDYFYLQQLVSEQQTRLLSYKS